MMPMEMEMNNTVDRQDRRRRRARRAKLGEDGFFFFFIFRLDFPRDMFRRQPLVPAVKGTHYYNPSSS